jgi:hypothetical protein
VASKSLFITRLGSMALLVGIHTALVGITLSAVSLSNPILIEKSIIFAYSFDLLEQPDPGRRLSRISRLRSISKTEDGHFIDLLSAIRNDLGAEEIASRFSVLFPPDMVEVTDYILREKFLLPDAVAIGTGMARLAVRTLWEKEVLGLPVNDTIPDIFVPHPTEAGNHTITCIFTIIKSAIMYLKSNELVNPPESVDICFPDIEPFEEAGVLFGSLSGGNVLTVISGKEPSNERLNPQFPITNCQALNGSKDDCSSLDPWACTTGGGCYVNQFGACDQVGPGYYSNSGDWFASACDPIPNDQYYVGTGWTNSTCPTRCIDADSYLNTTTSSCLPVPSGMFNSPCDNDPSGIYTCGGSKFFIYDNMCTGHFLAAYILSPIKVPIIVETWIKYFDSAIENFVSVFGSIGQWIVAISYTGNVVYCSTDICQRTDLTISTNAWNHIRLVTEDESLYINGRKQEMVSDSWMWAKSVFEDSRLAHAIGPIHFGPLYLSANHISYSLFDSRISMDDREVTPSYFITTPIDWDIDQDCFYGSLGSDRFCNSGFDFIVPLTAKQTSTTTTTTDTVTESSWISETTADASLTTVGVSETTTDSVIRTSLPSSMMFETTTDEVTSTTDDPSLSSWVPNSTVATDSMTDVSSLKNFSDTTTDTTELPDAAVSTMTTAPLLYPSSSQDSSPDSPTENITSTTVSSTMWESLTTELQGPDATADETESITTEPPVISVNDIVSSTDIPNTVADLGVDTTHAASDRVDYVYETTDGATTRITDVYTTTREPEFVYSTFTDSDVSTSPTTGETQSTDLITTLSTQTSDPSVASTVSPSLISTEYKTVTIARNSASMTTSFTTTIIYTTTSSRTEWLHSTTSAPIHIAENSTTQLNSETVSDADSPNTTVIAACVAVCGLVLISTVTATMYKLRRRRMTRRVSF